MKSSSPKHPLGNRVNLTCKRCGNKFEVFSYRRDIAKYCNNNCYVSSKKGQITWMKGKKHSEETKIKMSGKRPLVNSWSKGLTKETDERVKKLGEKSGKSRKGKFYPNKGNFQKGSTGPKNASYGKHHTKKYKLEKSEHMKKLFREGKLKVNGCAKMSQEGKLSGENHPNWLGGKSFEPYGIYFNNKLRKIIRERDNFMCQECDKSEKGLKRNLSIHHIDYNKKNNLQSNLISLCLGCHIKTNYNRGHWKRYFKNIMALREILNPENLLIFNENKQLIGVKGI